jgi:hypothetical protein
MTDPQNRIPRRCASPSELVAATQFLAVLTGTAGTLIPLEHADGLDECNQFHAAAPANTDVNQAFLDSDAMLLRDGRVLVTMQPQPTLE